MASSPKEKLVSIDLLRGIAATAVMLGHANIAYWASLPAQTSAFENTTNLFAHGQFLRALCDYLFGYGFLGVQLFFVISGFCIHLPYAGPLKELELRPFLLRRFFRIYPPYLVVVVSCMLLDGIRAGFGNGHVTALNLVGHLFVWHGFGPANSDGMGITPVLWTITIEVHFYLIYMVLYKRLQKYGWGRSALLGLAVDLGYRILWGSWLGELMPAYPFLRPNRFAPTRFGEFLLGAWIAELYAGNRIATPQFTKSFWTRPPTALGGGAMMVVLSIFIVHHTSGNKYHLDIPAVIGFACILLGFLGLEIKADSGFLSGHSLGRVLIWLGERSYSLYLVHLTLITLSFTLFRKLESYNPDRLSWVTLKTLAVALIGMASAVLVSHICYRLVESPSHQLGRRMARNVRSGSMVLPQHHTTVA